MNWKKLLLALVGLGLALVLIASIVLGLLAAAGVATVAAVADAIDEAGGITVTDAKGESFSLEVGESGGITFSDGDGEAFSIDVSEAGGIRFSDRDGDTATIEMDVPRITVTEGESGSARVIVPDLCAVCTHLGKSRWFAGATCLEIPSHDCGHVLYVMLVLQ